jgi:hypothetical protein
VIKKGLGYFTGLVALYIVVQQTSNTGRVITDGANGFSTVTRTLQGR